MFTWKRCIATAVAALLLALIFIMLILPGIIIDRASNWVAEETGRTLEIESIRINPFSLSVEVHKLQLSNADNTSPFINWDLLRLSLSMKSLYHRAPIIDEFRLDEPSLHLERLAADRFNFSDLIPQKEEEKATEATTETGRFSINNISINGGRIDFIDSSLATQVRHSVRDLQLILPTIGNLPYMVESPAQPLFHAEINDSPIHIEGRLKPFSNVQEMHVDLNLQNIDLPFYLGYVPMELPVEVRSGKLSLELDLLYRVSQETGGEIELSGTIDLASLNIRDRLQEQLFFMPLMQIEVAPSKPLEQDIHLSSLRIYNLEVQLNRDQQGSWNHARMAAAPAAPAAAETQEEPAKPLQLVIDTIKVRDGVVFFKDNLPEKGFETVLREINIDIENFALDAAKAIPLRLALETDREERLSVDGHFQLAPFTLKLKNSLQGLSLAAYEPYYNEFYKAPLAGKLSLQAELDVNPEQPLLISNGSIALREGYLAFDEQDGLGIDRIDISNLNYDLRANRLEVAAVRYEDGSVKISRHQDGQWSFFSNNFPMLSKLTESPDQEAEPVTEPEGQPFSYSLGELSIINWSFDVQDNLPATPAHLQASSFNLTVNNLAAPEEVESPFTFSTNFQRNGQIEIKGEASLAKQAIRISSELKQIPLTTFAPYIAEQANLLLADGFLNARVKSSIQAGTDPAQVSFNGDIGINRFHLLDKLHHEDLIKWKSLQVANLSGAVAPLTLDIESITLSEYFAKIIIDEEARLNLTEAFKKGSSVGEAAPNEEDLTAADSEPTAASPEINIKTVTLQGGHVDFTDRNLPQQFYADMRELGGRIQGLSSSAEARAEVDLRGQLRSQSPLMISGTINPLAEKLFVDLKLNFHDIELSSLSPYSSNYVGYLIEKGKLNLALEYYIDNDQLKAKNTVFLDQFTFGDAVESENATDLPVKLAVALLKDSSGEIHLDIPVYGNLDDPQFSIGGVVWTVIKNLLVKAATSPFALLGAMIGSGDEDFSSINFAHGSAILNPAEQDKLKRMAQALADRPGLELEISGFIDPENDMEGYRKEQLRMQIQRLKYLGLIKEEKLPEGTTQEELTVSVEEYADYLWEIYRETDFPKPRSFIGTTKKLPPEEMEKLIYANTSVTQSQLESLAQSRALTVQKFLIEEGPLEQKRVFLKKPDITAAPEQATAYRARVELGATVR